VGYLAVVSLYSRMTVSSPKPAVVVRDLTSIEDLRKIEAIEKEVWGVAERDVAPMTLLIASKEAGAIFLGAFDGDEMVGFAYGFPSLENGHVAIHSHMLAVLPQYRDLNLGYQLKLAQRERTLAMGISEMSWTFDPLQSRNAHFNFAKLGVVSDRYKVDFYGQDSSSVLHQNGTDRLWLTWLLDSARVKQRLNGTPPNPSEAATVLACDAQRHPQRAKLDEMAAHSAVLIGIPDDIVAIESCDSALAWQWRLATRWAFTELLQAGFFVAEFLRGQNGTGNYLLRRGEMREFVAT
jgi:predicted GNAT superfamily acetyltransferase